MKYSAYLFYGECMTLLKLVVGKIYSISGVDDSGINDEWFMLSWTFIIGKIILFNTAIVQGAIVTIHQVLI